MGFALDATSGQGACRPMDGPGVQRRNERISSSWRGRRTRGECETVRCSATRRTPARAGWTDASESQKFSENPLDTRERSEL
jgi:hypothetical protein